MMSYCAKIAFILLICTYVKIAFTEAHLSRSAAFIKHSTETCTCMYTRRCSSVEMVDTIEKLKQMVRTNDKLLSILNESHWAKL